MKKAILGSLAVLPLAAAGVFANAGAADAAALNQFQFSGGFSNVDFSSNGIVFGELPDGENQIIITPGSQTGIFTGFQAAYISNIVPIPDMNPSNNPFLDLELLFGANPPSGDGNNVFNLTRVDPFELGQSGENVDVDLPVFGKFIINGMEIGGAGNLTWQINDTTVADVESDLADGETFENLGFSGAAFTASVPEPATILGLGVVAGSLALSRAGKKNKA